MSRIAGRFQALAEQGRKALIPYIVAGDPNLEVTLATMHALVAAGADIIELGVPFSDPMAEGPVIQLAHERSLANGTSLRDVVALVAQFRQTDNDTPVLLMGYANPVMHMGYAEFTAAASEAGVDALLSVDIPYEEVAEVKKHLQAVGMDNIFLIAPTTPDDRIRRICAQASGFVYYVSLKGVTGSGALNVDTLAGRVAKIRAVSELPVAVGFGIKDEASATAVAAIADGVVVGSALVARMAQSIENGSNAQESLDSIIDLFSSLRRGVDAAS